MVCGHYGDSARLSGATLAGLMARIKSDNERWWRDPATHEPKERNVGEVLMLMVSELSEAMEGDRKNLMDDKLPHRKMFDVELADCLIRILDAAAHWCPDFVTIITEKLDYNNNRADHTDAARLAGGKKY